jgi:hypothetical protein
MPEITFIIDRDGNVKIEGVCGAPGKTCLDVTKEYEEILGTVRESTREYTEDLPEMEQNVSQQNG